MMSGDPHMTLTSVKASWTILMSIMWSNQMILA